MKEIISSALQNDSIVARHAASIVGRIISMGLGIGPIARLRTRNLYALLGTRCSWYDRLVINEEAKDELGFWLSNLDQINGMSMWKTASAVRIVYSDASSTGYGGYVVEHGRHFAHGQWSEDEMGKSSTWRELMAVARFLHSVAHKLRNHRVTDNKNVVQIIMVGSRTPNLQSVAVDIFKLACLHAISLEPEWIPRDENDLADYVSRIVDYDDWMINSEVFHMLDTLWGPHSVDQFASWHNVQLE